MKYAPFLRVCVCGGFLLSAGAVTCLDAAVIFENRQNVNLLNARDVIITATDQDNTGTSFRGDLAQHLRFPREGANVLAWEGNVGAHGDASLTMDFQRPQNIKTIRYSDPFSNYGFQNGQSALIETSNDGVVWTPQAHTVSSIATAGTLTLNAAVNARYLRISNPNPQDTTTHRWRASQLRVYGDTGMLTDAHGSMDLISASGFSTPMSLSTIGSVSVTAVTLAQFIDDAPPLARQVLFNVGSGDGFVVNLGQSFKVGTFGLVLGNNGGFDFSPIFTVATSLDGVNFTTRINGTSQVVDENEFSLGGVEAQYIRFLYSSTTDADTRISDFYAYAYVVPEPGSVMLMGFGAWCLLWFRRTIRSRRP